MEGLFHGWGLSEISRANLKDYAPWLAGSKKLKAKTINNMTL